MPRPFPGELVPYGGRLPPVLKLFSDENIRKMLVKL
jgi:hypothetical protein